MNTVRTQLYLSETSGNGLFLLSNNQGVIHAYGGSGGGVYLKHNNDTKFKVEGGNIATDGGADFTFEGASYNAVWDTSNNALEFADNAKARFGTGNDLEVYHASDSSYIDEVGGGSLFIRTNGPNVFIGKTTGSEYMAVFTPDGAVSLRYDNATKLETSASGVTVTGTLAATAVTGDGSGLTNLPAAAASGVFYENDTNVSSNYTITSNKNAMSAGPITIDSGVTVTVPSGSAWTVVA